MREPQSAVEGPIVANPRGGSLTDEQVNGLLLGCELIMEVLTQQSGSHDRFALGRHAQALMDILADRMPLRRNHHEIH